MSEYGMAWNIVTEAEEIQVAEITHQDNGDCFLCFWSDPLDMLHQKYLQTFLLFKTFSNKAYGLRKLSVCYSALNYDCLQPTKKFKHIFNENKKQCYICNNNTTVRYLKTNIISSDNIVSSPYNNDCKIPDRFLHEILWQNIEQWPDKIAIECFLTKRKYTYAQLQKLSKKFGAALLKSGFKPGQVIALVLPNLSEFPIAAFGAIEAGLIISPINPVYTADEMCHQILDSKSIGVITFAGKLNVVQEAKKKVEIKTKGSVSLKIISIQDFDGKSRPLPEGVWSFREMSESNLDTSLINSVYNEYNKKKHDIAVLPYSSGTTGLPKGVCLRHNNLAACFIQMEQDECRIVNTTSGDFQDVVPSVLPFFHIYGFTVTLMDTLMHGAKIVTLPQFDAESYLKLLKEQKCTVLYVVPPMVLFLGGHPAVTKEHFHHVHYVVSGAAPLGLSDIEKCVNKLPGTAYLIQGYGLTETSVAMISPNTSRKMSSVGYPVPLSKAKVIDDNGKSVGFDKTGEICVYGPQVMKEYLNKPEATAETVDKDGWLHTGDVGYYDKDGLFYIMDRKKELIKVKGFQVAPAELEDLLKSHPKVADAAVIGVPDERAGEVPVAYVIPKPGKEKVQSDDVKKYIAEKVAHYKQLSSVVFTDTIPKSASGKILRRMLKETHLKGSK
ncbi:uncharacterized protein LOC142330877 [Lycorma delicatula]|uniref:uncharacterized protein LOC142330877 n=1 Tax=Lycorma delicatula TaxID=130591 RepID=UPI003F513513